MGPARPKKNIVHIPPINHVDGLDCPVIFSRFAGQGGAVGPSGSDGRGVEEKRIAVAYVTFPKRATARQAANIRAALEGELYFYGKVFKIEPADNLETLLIENL